MYIFFNALIVSQYSCFVYDSRNYLCPDPEGAAEIGRHIATRRAVHTMGTVAIQFIQLWYLKKNTKIHKHLCIKVFCVFQSQQKMSSFQNCLNTGKYLIF